MCRDGGFIFWKGIDMRKKVWLFALAAVLLVILAGCRGNELPDGMDEGQLMQP